MSHFEEVLGCLREAGFSGRAQRPHLGVIFAYVCGYVVAFRPQDHLAQAKQIVGSVGPADYPHAIEATTCLIEQGDRDQTSEFVAASTSYSRA